MNLTTVPVTVVSDVRRSGWRSILRNGGVTVWRCTCDWPHRSARAADVCGLAELRTRLGQRGMRVWAATYRPKQQFTPEEIDRMDEERSLALLEIQTNPALPTWENPEAFPTAVAEVRAAIVRYERIMLEDESWDRVCQTRQLLKTLIGVFADHTEIRQQAEISLLCGEKRIAGEFVKAQDDGLINARGRPAENSVAATKFSIPEIFGKGGHNFVRRLRVIHPLTYDEIRTKSLELHLAGKDATLNAIYELIQTEQTRERRHASLYAEPFPDGMEYRIGSNRDAFADVADGSVSVVITDPPYGRDSADNFEWLGPFCDRVLMPGGSLICYTGTGMVLRDGAILQRHLTYHWMGVLLHADGQKMLGAGVRSGYKPILWFIKGDGRRRIVHGRRTLVPDVLNDRRPAATQEEYDEQTDSGRALSAKDKSDHGWAQGDAGVRVWIHHLSAPGEVILDPFAGTGKWGRIAADMGRRWIGCDIAEGGTESVLADELDEAAD